MISLTGCILRSLSQRKGYVKFPWCRKDHLGIKKSKSSCTKQSLESALHMAAFGSVPDPAVKGGRKLDSIQRLTAVLVELIENNFWQHCKFTWQPPLSLKLKQEAILTKIFRLSHRYQHLRFFCGKILKNP
ncbi:hypothetical protein AVEN_227408-1 [Araneus ventricosus]|uniref:Uncharacterized protein n=1 Tax=Araneus ventricosus TaxID=182803 RepID=A0A4Y2PV94_ARAVE|nr:hypothetical protein AVEN_227408-1 [Araneus ventricosus]